MTHLSPELIDRYRGRRLTAPEMLALGDHLATCEACRGRLAAGLPTRAVVEVWRAELATAGAEPRHLVAEDLDRLVDGTLDGIEREVAQSHLATCDVCTSEVNDLQAFRTELASRPGESAHGSRLRSWSHRLRAGALAAGLFLAVALGVVRQWSVAPVYRDTDANPIESRVPEGESLSRKQCLLRWKGPSGATYELSVTTEDLRVVHAASGLKREEYRVPEDFLAQLPSGAKLLWQVTARLPDGTVARGTTFTAVGCTE